jgi:hypothetical protein
MFGIFCSQPIGLLNYKVFLVLERNETYFIFMFDSQSQSPTSHVCKQHELNFCLKVDPKRAKPQQQPQHLMVVVTFLGSKLEGLEWIRCIDDNHNHVYHTIPRSRCELPSTWIAIQGLQNMQVLYHGVTIGKGMASEWHGCWNYTIALVGLSPKIQLGYVDKFALIPIN